MSKSLGDRSPLGHISLGHISLSTIPLRIVLIVPFVLQIFAAVGITGYLSLKNGEKAVEDLVQQLEQQAANRVDQHLDTYLALPHQLNQITLDAIDRGLIDLRNIQSSGRYFWKQVQTFKQISYNGYSLTDNSSAGAGRWLKGYDIVISQNPGKPKDSTYATDPQGNMTKVVSSQEYDSTTDTWYVDTVKAGKPIWSRIYTAEAYGVYVAASANTPIYDKNRQLLGVLNIDLLLSDISQFLQKIQVSPSSQIFIIERDGRLIATSGQQTILFKEKDQIERYTLASSPDPLMQLIDREMQQKFNTLQSIQSTQNLELTINGQHQYVNVTPWQDEYGLDWLVIVTIPESDFTAQINANTRTTLLSCLAALLVATLLGISTARWISQPILALNEASQAIAAGDLNQQVASTPIQELSTVGKSFNRMAAQMRSSFMALEQSNLELEERVTERTQELSERNTQLNTTLAELHRTQTQMVQSEKMSALGKTVAGIAHEINNPVSFIHGNLAHVQSYTANLLEIIHLYQHHYPHPAAEITAKVQQLELDFIQEDLPSTLSSMKLGTDRIRAIILSLRNFSRLDESEYKAVDIHEGIDSTLLILQHRFRSRANRSAIQVVKDYAPLPLIECYPGQLNQVFMNILANALDAIEDALKERAAKVSPPEYQDQPGQITIRTTLLDLGDRQWVQIAIADNGIGIPVEAKNQIFDPFFTTKPIGKGTGMSMSISYQIITEKHQGKLECHSAPGAGTEFIIQIPIQQ